MYKFDPNSLNASNHQTFREKNISTLIAGASTFHVSVMLKVGGGGETWRLSD